MYRAITIGALAVLLVSPGALAAESEPAPPPQQLSSLDISYARTDIEGESIAVDLDTIIQSTLENNFDIRIEQINVPISIYGIEQERAAFDPTFSAIASYERSLTQAATDLEGADMPETKQSELDLSLRQKIATGAQYGLTYENTRLRTNNQYVPLNPRYDVALKADITQPLLRDCGIDINSATIRQAENSIMMAEQEYRRQVIDALAGAINTYWELIFNIMDLRVRQAALRQAEQLRDENRARFRAGTIPRTDVLQAEASVATRMTDIVIIRAQIETIEDQLKRHMNLPAKLGEHVWDLPLDPKTAPDITDFTPDTKGSLELARDFRPDYRRFLLELKNRNIELDYRRNQMWPSLNLHIAGRLAGIGGKPRPGAAVDEDAAGSYGAAFSNATSGDYYSFEIGATLEIPLGNRLRRSAYRTAVLHLEQTHLRFERLKQDITVEIRNAVRALQTARAEINATDIERRAQWRKLEAERQRFEAGQVTSFEVLTFQEEFAIAQRRYIRSIIGYNQAFVNLQRIQGTLLEHLHIVLEY